MKLFERLHPREIRDHLRRTREDDWIPFNEEANLYLSQEVTLFRENLSVIERERLYSDSDSMEERVIAGLSLNYTYDQIEANEKQKNPKFKGLKSVYGTNIWDHKDAAHAC
jgi:hypothetical protein